MESTLVLTPRFVTPEDFKTYTGIDLSEELAAPQTPNSFILGVEQRILNFISLQSWIPLKRMIELHRLSKFQQDSLALAILQQARYEFYNGTLTMNSGIDPEKGIINDRDSLNRATICQDAMDTLQCSGLLKRVMRGLY